VQRLDVHTSKLFAGLSQPSYRGRSTEREADWRKANAQIYAYQSNKHPEREAEFYAEYEQAEIEGPDFKRIHRNARYCDAPPVILTHRERMDWRKALRKAMGLKRSTKYRHSRKTAITRTVIDVGRVLLDYQRRFGTVFPSYKAMAWRARCSRRSVHYALAELEALGFITRKARRELKKQGLRNREHQTSNAYVLTHPSQIEALRLKRASATAKTRT
jgi:hypothetical protein